MVSSSSPSFKRSSKNPISLDNLPEDLLVDISLRVGTSSIPEYHNLRKVSKSFQRFCNQRYVLHNLSLHDLESFLYNYYQRPPNYHENVSNFFNRCVENENPVALYRKGFDDYFYGASDDRREKGLEYLAKSAKKGNRKAQYISGIILICIGGKTKHTGFKFLSAFKKSLMLDTMEEMEKFRRIRDNILWRDRRMMRQLKGRYVREKCGCNGQTEKFMKMCSWHRYGEGNNMLTSSACESCLYNHEVELFLDSI